MGRVHSVKCGELARRFVGTVSAGALMIGCGAAQKDTASEPESSDSAATESSTSSKVPLDVEGLLARETSGLSPQKIEEKNFRASVLAKGALKVSPTEAGAQIEVPIGTQATVKCIVFKEDPDPGATIYGMLERMKTIGELQEVRLMPMEVIKEAPTLGLSVIYVVHSPEGNKFGQLKAIHHARLDHSTLCLHDEPGYQESFAKVARSLFESQDRGVTEAQPQYVEVQLAQVNGAPAGYDKTLVLHDDGGNRTVVSSGLILLMRSPTDLNASDTATVNTVDPHGIVVNGRYISVENGRVTVDIALTHKRATMYDYKGTIEGKQISGSFKTMDKRGLVSSLETEKQLAQKLARGGAFSMKDESYDPTSDPTKTSPVEYRHAKEDPPRLVRMKLQNMEVVGTADEAGRMQDGEMKMGPLTVTLKRAFARSAP